MSSGDENIDVTKTSTKTSHEDSAHVAIKVHDFNFMINADLILITRQSFYMYVARDIRTLWYGRCAIVLR